MRCVWASSGRAFDALRGRRPDDSATLWRTRSGTAHASLSVAVHSLGGRFWEVTLLLDAMQAMRLATEATFGPLATVFRLRGEEHSTTDGRPLQPPPLPRKPAQPHPGLCLFRTRPVHPARSRTHQATDHPTATLDPPATRRLTSEPDGPDPPLASKLRCLKAFDDGQTQRPSLRPPGHRGANHDVAPFRRKSGPP